MMAGCLALVLILYFSRMASGEKQSSSVASWLLTGMLVVGGAFSSAPLMSRLENSGFTDTVRSEISARTIDAIAASPAAGNGFGAFEQYYPLYATNVIRGTINDAHNDYLETLADLGLVGGIALIFAPAYLAFLAGQGAFRRRKGRVYGAAAAGAAVLCGVHAMFEYSLQIPAVGVLFSIVLGIGVAQAWRGVDEEGDARMRA
jgi:O-antigen ligase